MSLTPKGGQVFSLTARDLKNHQIGLLPEVTVVFLSSKIVLWGRVLLLKFQTLTLSIVEIISLTISENHLTITAIVVA